MYVLIESLMADSSPIVQNYREFGIPSVSNTQVSTDDKKHPIQVDNIISYATNSFVCEEQKCKLYIHKEQLVLLLEVLSADSVLIEPRFQECDQENIQNWLECDVDDPGHQALTDDEIIASVIDDQDLCDEAEVPSDEDCAEKGPSSEEAFHCLETAMKWVEQQEECDAVQLLCLKHLQDSDEAQTQYLLVTTVKARLICECK
ncbi:hypothetical protein C0J52_17959 [Blattella germanica]|nr:hypothetical protein C0J52_17959 [Blattella germanica]